MSYLSIFFLSFSIAFSGVLAPGPLMAAVIGESCRSGVRAGPLIWVGHAAAEAAMLGAILLGFGELAGRPAFFNTAMIAGGISLLVYGTLMLGSRNPVASTTRGGNLVLAGAVLSVANPYWILWWVTVGLGLALTAQKSGPAAVAVFFSGHVSADLAWNSFVSFTLGRNRRFISDTVYGRLRLVCALALFGFGILFIAKTVLSPR